MAGWLPCDRARRHIDAAELAQQGSRHRYRLSHREEEGTRPPSRTIALRSGSCRDLTALFLCTARRLGFAARAASGYLFEPGSVAGDIGEPMPGEVFLPGDGWVTFDLIQRGMDSAGLVTTAIGVTSEAVLPVGGGFLYDADDFVGMEERVVSRHSTFVR